MRWLLTIALLAAMNPWWIAFAQPTAADQLPPCCRGSGKHKCALRMARALHRTGITIGAANTCPYSNSSRTYTAAQPFWLHRPAAGRSTVLPPIAALRVPVHFAPRDRRFIRACQKRGPPLSFA